VLLENLCAHNILLLKFMQIFADDQGTFSWFLHILSLVVKLRMSYHNLECRNTTVLMFNRDQNFKLGIL